MSEGPPTDFHERTALAWQRTSLAIVAGSAVLTRITIGRIGLVALLSVVIGAPLGLWVMFESRERYRSRVASPSAAFDRGGRAAAALAVATFAVGVTGLVAVFAG
jgi:hypothetical protein